MRRWVAILVLMLAPALRAGETHWAFVRPTEPTVPQVTDPAWCRSPLDHFILAKLTAAALKHAEEADRRTLIRRATFDLTGLPPKPEDVEAFVADASADAYEKVVDRLLASFAYGERWGRHWLDVARYADSNGLDENYAYANAWRYRDYVIAAFNADKPYDRFLAEQIAGDLLPPLEDSPQRHERLIATGFLALGPKVLSEPDAKKMEMDVIDEQVDTLGRAALGMTFGCARCHDHKFDPISAEDYYGLAGIFTSTRTMARYARPSSWYEHLLGSPKENAKRTAHEAEVAKIRAAIDEAANKDDAKALKRSKAELAKLEKNAPVVASALGVTDGTVADTVLLTRGDYLQPGPTVDRRFPRAIAGNEQPPLPKDHSGRLELATWLTRPDHPLTARVMVNRIWRWHFGRGIVGSPDNFGLLGEPPTHPELLDWLATQFVKNGWSVKAMHRLIMLSATYRTATSSDPVAFRIDPGNRLYARTTPRRLEGEALRDAILFTSGTLDTSSPGGPAITHVKNRERVFDVTSKDETTYDSRRRSVYLPVVRNNVYDVFTLFDCPDAAVPTGDRTTTTVAPQALFMLNGGLVLDAAEALAKDLLARGEIDDAARIQSLYARAHGRPAGKTELQRATSMITDFQRDAAKDRAQAWTWFCQTILAANEFVYVN